MNQLLKRNALSLTISTNDMFANVCIDTVDLDIEHLEWAEDVINEYGQDGYTAVLSVLTGNMPIREYRTGMFEQAYEYAK